MAAETKKEIKNDIVFILGGKVIGALKVVGFNVSDFQPKIVQCKIDNVDYAVSNMRALFKKNGEETVLLKLDQLCKELNDNADDLYTVTLAKMFLNFTINKKYFHKFICDVLTSDSIIARASKKKIIAIDFSSPNVAKDMHVGHLRSTIIGDVIANLAEKRGHEVHRINHIGDFGQNFGMIIEWIIANGLSEKVLANEVLPVSLQDIYKKSKIQYESDSAFQEASSRNTVMLQNYDSAVAHTDPKNVVKLWKAICELSRKNYQSIYDRLSIRIVECGESFYQKYIPGVIAELNEKKLTKYDASSVEPEKKRLVIESPYTLEKKKDDSVEISHDYLTLVKHNLGYTYDTTDVACLSYRLNVLRADVVYYVVDAGQGTHFIQLFDVAKKAGWLERSQMLQHVDFGVVCGEDGKRLRSRDGDSIKLNTLLDTALLHTKKAMILNFHSRQNRMGSDEEKKEHVFDEGTVKSLAYGSIKYADLCVNRKANYTFSYERMLNFKGNTLIFLMYARIRALAIINKAPKELTKSAITEYISQFKTLSTNPELNQGDYAILFKLSTLENIISEAEDGYPHHICAYLFELAELLNQSYTQNRCITYDTDGIKIISVNKSRLALYLTLVKIMDTCFSLLNIDLIDKL